DLPYHSPARFRGTSGLPQAAGYPGISPYFTITYLQICSPIAGDACLVCKVAIRSGGCYYAWEVVVRRTGVIAAPRRLLLVLALALVLPFALVDVKESNAQAGPTHPIAATAMKYLNTHGGQCWTFMKKVVAEATGR